MTGTAELDITDPDLVSAEVAHLLIKRSTRTLFEWRENGKGPKWIRYGGRIFYRRSWIAEWKRAGEPKRVSD